MVRSIEGAKDATMHSWALAGKQHGRKYDDALYSGCMLYHTIQSTLHSLLMLSYAPPVLSCIAVVQSHAAWDSDDRFTTLPCCEMMGSLPMLNNRDSRARKVSMIRDCWGMERGSRYSFILKGFTLSKKDPY